MSFFRGLIAKNLRAVALPDGGDRSLFQVMGGMTSAGVRVTEESSLQSTTVFAAMRVIAESVASLPLVLYRQNGRAKERATDHPLYPVLHDLANSEITAMELRETALGRAVLWGTAYCEIEYDGGGRIRGLWPLQTNQALPIRDESGRLWLQYRLPSGEEVRIPWYRVYKVMGVSRDGIVGYQPIRLAMQAVGLALATERYGAAFFGNGAQPGGVLEHPGSLSKKARDALREQWTEMHSGLSNAQRVAILEEGMKFHGLAVNPDVAQFLETRRFQVTEIARLFRIPPHLLADLDRATFSNIEQQSLEFVTYTLTPWFVRIEQAISRDLLTPAERNTLFAKHIAEGLLRGDMKTRYEAHATAIQNGWKTRNEARELEDLNPLDGLDEPLVPLNMVEEGQAAPTPARDAHAHAEQRIRPEVSEPAAWDRRAADIATDRRAVMQRHVRLWEDAAARAIRREAADIRRAVPRFFGKRSSADFLEWLTGFYTDMRAWLPDYFRALMTTYAEAMFAEVSRELGDPVAIEADRLSEWVDGYLRNLTESWAVGSEKQLRTVVLDAEDEEAAATAVGERLDGWENTQPGKTALEQAFEAGNALAILGYVAVGVATLRWAAQGESCPLCQKLDGTRIPIGGAFVDEGDTVTAEGVDPLPVIRKIKHGPLHGGCDCVVIAG